MFCPKCGKEVVDDAVICVHCGRQISPSAPTMSTSPAMAPTPAEGKDWLTTVLLCFFFGAIGIHSFYVGKTAIGVVQLLTCGGCGVWAFVDFIMILVGSYKDGEGRPLIKH